MVKLFSEKEKHLDFLINNSGLSWGGQLETFSEKAWDKVMNLNTKPIFFLIQKLLPLLKNAGTIDSPSRILNISSIVSIHPDSMNAFSYGPSKAAVNQLTRILARELAKDHISVNAIGPGFFPSRMTSNFDDQDLINRTPMGRIDRPTDISGLVIFLCSSVGSFLTGTFIPIDGGILIK